MTKSINAPPRFAVELITFIVDEPHKEDIIGDIWEEYTQLRNHSTVKAYLWFWMQFISILGYVLRNAVSMYHVRLFSILIVSTYSTIFATAVALLSWLLNTEQLNLDSSAELSTLLFGHFHSFYHLPELWEFSYQRVDILIENIFHSKAFIWSVTVSAVGSYYYHGKKLSKSCFVVIGYVLLFLPYIASTFLLSYIHLGIQQIGEILGLMLYTLIYASLPISILSIMKLTRPR